MKTFASKAAIWGQQVRGPFLILSPVLVFIGVAMAAKVTAVNWISIFLLGVGVTLAHMAVNLLNELSDYKTGIDAHTDRTPFSGGSGMMQAGKTSIQSVRLAAYASMTAAAAIGVYFFIIRGWLILLLMIAGGLVIRFYTSVLARWMVGELAAGLTLGTLVVLGSFYALTGQINSSVLAVSIPPGLLTSLLLYLNEFPDVQADQLGGRHHLVIHFGAKKGAWIYLFCLVFLYLFVLAMPFLFAVPATVLMVLATLPLAAKAGITLVRNHDDRKKVISAMGVNIIIVLLTDFLLGLAFIIS